MKPVRTHTFNGVHYEIIFASDVEGFIEQPDEPRVFFIKDSGDEKTTLESIVHEATHAIDPKMREKRVEQLSTGIVRFLWRLGYRWQGH